MIETIFIHVRPFPSFAQRAPTDDLDVPPPVKTDCFSGDLFATGETATLKFAAMLGQVADNLVANEWLLREHLPVLADFMMAAAECTYELADKLCYGEKVARKRISDDAQDCLHRLQVIASSSEYLLRHEPKIGKRMWKLAGMMGLTVAVAAHNGLVEPPYEGFVEGANRRRRTRKSGTALAGEQLAPEQAATIRRRPSKRKPKART